MRLFGKLDGGISRFDRAALLTPPFDRSLRVDLGPWRTQAALVACAGVAATSYRFAALAYVVGPERGAAGGSC